MAEMNGLSRLGKFSFFLSILLAMFACSTLEPSPTSTPEPPTLPPPTRTPAPTPIPEHVIGVRLVNGRGEFYDRSNGEKFVPRGMNYARLDHIVGGGHWHSTFDPYLYDPGVMEQALARMEADGYNVVRVFIDCCSAAGLQVGDYVTGISGLYMEKVVDFLQRARTHHIYVLLCVDLTPGEGSYNDPMWKEISTIFDGENLRYLTEGGLQAKREYMLDFVQSLLDRNAPLEAIFAYDLTNEVHFDSSKPPLSLVAGMAATANGQIYDMSIPEEKDRMVEDNLIYWIDDLRALIRQLDPTALVTTSFFVPQKPVPTRIGDTRYILTDAVINRSTADFIDLHPYPGWGPTFSEYARNFGVDTYTRKPVIMGEFGANQSVFPSIKTAARVLRDWQIESCQYGFDGWLLWTWDSQESVDLWNALSQDGEIEKILAPVNWPDPCAR